MIVYRGTRDVLPHLLDHRKIAKAVYGDATYYALSKELAEEYSQGGYFDCQVVCSYELEVKALEINSEDWEGVDLVLEAKKLKKISMALKEGLGLEKEELSPVNLVEALSLKGYDACILKGKIEGGEQLILPLNHVQPVLVSLDVVLSKRKLGHAKDGKQVEKFILELEKAGVVVEEKEFKLHFSLTPFQVQDLEELFSFLEVTSGRSFLDIDFEKKFATDYEDDY